MAMACCPEEYDEESETLGCVDAPAPHNPDLYSHLRSDLLASSWLPSPLGMFLWRALHVMLLIVNGPIYWALELLGAFIYNAVLVSSMLLIFLICSYMVFGLIAVAIDLILRSISFCSSLVGFLASREPIFNYTGDIWVVAKLELWKGFKSVTRTVVWKEMSIGVPCISGSLYQETKNQKLETWARWWEEVVHKHDAIAV